MNRPTTTDQVIYKRFRYICTCEGTKHVAIRFFDEMPPEQCQAGSLIRKDLKWEDESFEEARRLIESQEAGRRGRGRRVVS